MYVVHCSALGYVTGRPVCWRSLVALLASVYAMHCSAFGCCHWLACMLGCFMWPTSASMHVGCWGMVPGWPRRLLRDGSGGGSAGTDPSGAFERCCASSDQADKGFKQKKLACTHTLHIVVA